MASQLLKFNVEMTCEGCSGAIQRILGKYEGKGVESFNIDLPNKVVSVTTTLPANEILDIIKKSGKTTTLIEAN